MRYGAESLIGRDFFEVHRAVVAFLAGIGFTVTKEILSRVDMQILIERKTNEFIRLIVLEHAVAKARKSSIHKNGKKFQTYTLGGKKSIQLCIYDKMEEFATKMLKSDPAKACLFLRHCIGDDALTQNVSLTRVEFRLGRNALAAFEIDSVEDLRNKEAALVDWLTSEWFRILRNPKVRGHENTAEQHEIWCETRMLFERYFSGPERREPVQWRKRGRVSCDPEALEKQAAGCMAAAIALRDGEQSSPESVLEKAILLLWNLCGKMYDKANKVAKEIETLKGVTLGKVVEWEP